MSGTEVVVALLIAVGLVGVLIPMLPGSLLVLLAILLWAVDLATTTGWVFFTIAVVLLATGVIVKYAIPGRRLKTSGIPSSTLLFGGLLGIVGFFVVPVVGVALGFVLGVYLAELRRLRDRGAAWRATVQALQAAGLAMLIEFGAALLAAVVWGVGVVVS
ncbi:MAG: hypothetical protein JWR35_1741 [Marmoricola sp.]|nr:hypothetical protein [Marmoricola sp.]